VPKIDTDVESELSQLLEESRMEYERRFKGLVRQLPILFFGTWIAAAISAIFLLDIPEALIVNVFMAVFFFLLFSKSDLRRAYSRMGADWMKDVKPGNYFLFLRPFDADRLPGVRPRIPLIAAAQFGVLGTMLSQRNRSMGEALSYALKDYKCELVALGRPTNWIPRQEFRTLYVSSNWQAAVLCLARCARGVIFNSGSTDSMIWELSHIRNEIVPSKVFLYTSIDGEERSSWHKTWEALSEAGWLVPTEFPGHGCLISFDQHGEGKLLSQSVDSEVTLAAQLLWATEDDDPSPKEQDGRPSKDVGSSRTSEALDKNITWSWDPRTGNLSPVQDVAEDWMDSLWRNIFSAGPVGCFVIWLALSAVIGTAILTGKVISTVYSVQRLGAGIALILGLPAIFAGYITYKLVGPIVFQIASSRAKWRSRPWAWALALGFPVLAFMLGQLIWIGGGSISKLREPTTTFNRLEKECQTAAKDSRLEDLERCLTEAAELPHKYPSSVKPASVEEIRHVARHALEANWPKVVSVSLTKPDLFNRLEHILTALSLNHLKPDIQTAARVRMRELGKRGVLVNVELLDGGTLLRSAEGTTEADLPDAIVRCLSVGNKDINFYSAWPLRTGSHEANGAATLEASLQAEAKIFGDEYSGDEALRIPQSAMLDLSINGETRRIPTAGLSIGDYGSVDFLKKQREEAGLALFSKLCEGLGSRQIGAWIQSRMLDNLTAAQTPAN
jgi:hypothetical protein